VPDAQTLKSAGHPVAHQPGEDEFRRAVAEMDTGMSALRDLRPDLAFEPEPPPRRLAPLAHAVAATVFGSPGPADADDTEAGSGDAELGSGKFILLFDAAGQPGWDGKYRIIGYVQAELEPEMTIDPLINEVGWSWLTEALDTRSSGYRKISGTVTTVATQGFGSKADEPTSTSFELRASWSPAIVGSQTGDGDSAELDAHVAAWCDVICRAAGLPPIAPGVTAFRAPRRWSRP